jgi:hypothetical protein
MNVLIPIPIEDVRGIEICCANCGMGLLFGNPVASAVQSECVACGMDISKGILAAKQFFEFELTALNFKGVVRIRTGQRESTEEK